MQQLKDFTNKELSILRYFYEQKAHRIGYVRQIKRYSGLSEHTLLKYLGVLENKKIIQARKQGNLKIFEINLKNPLVKIFFGYFDIIKMEDLEYKRKRAIQEFLLKIQGIKLPYFILLFGSTAKGNYTKTSDIDIIPIFEKYDKTIKNKIEELTKTIYAETGLRINFLLMNLNEFIKEKDNKENYALQDALQTGYPILGNDLFYEIVLKP